MPTAEGMQQHEWPWWILPTPPLLEAIVTIIWIHALLKLGLPNSRVAGYATSEIAGYAPYRTGSITASEKSPRGTR